MKHLQDPFETSTTLQFTRIGRPVTHRIQVRPISVNFFAGIEAVP